LLLDTYVMYDARKNAASFIWAIPLLTLCVLYMYMYLYILILLVGSFYVLRERSVSVYGRGGRIICI
jgi:hypothetical protein